MATMEVTQDMRQKAIDYKKSVAGKFMLVEGAKIKSRLVGEDFAVVKHEQAVADGDQLPGVLLIFGFLKTLVQCGKKGVGQIFEATEILGVLLHRFPPKGDPLMDGVLVRDVRQIVIPMGQCLDLGLLRRGSTIEQLVGGHTEEIGEGDNEGHVGQGVVVLPLGDGLVGNIQILRQLFLGNAVLLTELLDLFTDGHGELLSFTCFCGHALIIHHF